MEAVVGLKKTLCRWNQRGAQRSAEACVAASTAAIQQLKKRREKQMRLKSYTIRHPEFKQNLLSRKQLNLGSNKIGEHKIIRMGGRTKALKARLQLNKQISLR